MCDAAEGYEELWLLGFVRKEYQMPHTHVSDECRFCCVPLFPLALYRLFAKDNTALRAGEFGWRFKETGVQGVIYMS